MGKKGTSKREKTWEKHGLVHLHGFFAFSICIVFCFYFACFLLFAWEEAKQMQNKSKQKQIEKTK